MKSGFLVMVILFVVYITNINPALSKDSSTDEIPIIPLETLFGNPDIEAPQLSPDGKYVSYMAPYEGVMNIWIRTLGKKDDRPLTKFTDRPPKYHRWTYHNNYTMFYLDHDGDERLVTHIVDLDGNIKCLTPDEPEGDFTLHSLCYGVNWQYPDELIICMTLRDKWLFDYYRVNLVTGKKELVKEAENPFEMWFVDNNLNLLGYYKFNPDSAKAMRC